MRVTELEIHKEVFTFSAGHFTIFSATERETLHGHNYNVSVAFTFKVEHNGLAFDYRFYKQKISALCKQLNTLTLLPANSAYLRIEDHDPYWHVYFNTQKMFFLKEDILILPLTNITIEELSSWFLKSIISDQEQLYCHNITDIKVKVFNGPDQSASATFHLKEKNN